MKRQLVLLMLALLLSKVCRAATEIGGIYYNLNSSSKTAEVTNGTKKYTGSVTIPASVSYDGVKYSVTSIGSDAFSGCSGLTSITIPSSVTSIGRYAFYDCSGLTSITIPSGLTSIGSGAFSSCSSLTSIVVDANNTKFDSRNNCNAIIETATNTLVAGCKNTTIPSSVTSIGSSAFNFCSSLTSIMIPSSVTSIRDWAFACSGLTSLTIPASVTSIGNYAFTICSGLTSVTIPASVTSIGYHTFERCSGLTSIVVDADNIKYDSRNNCNAIIETSTNTLITGCKATIIPSSVTSIRGEVFLWCTGLASVTIPNGVTSINGYTFAYCSGLTSVTIPNSVTSIGYSDFIGCSGLTDFYCYAENLPITKNDTFSSSNIANATLHVPAASISAYQTTEPWSGFKEVVPIEEEDDLQRYLDSLVDGEDELTDNIYRREFKNGDWQSLYIPFEMDYSDWSDKFDVASINGLRKLDGHIVIEATILENGTLKANYPYLIRAKSNDGAMLTVNVIGSVTQTTNTVTYYGLNYTEGMTTAHQR